MRSLRSVLSFVPIAMMLFASPAASGPFGEVWQTAHSERYHLYEFVDLDGDGSLEFLTGEYTTGTREFIGVRSVATGALLAQSAALYEPTDLFVADLDGNGTQEILFTTDPDGRLNCLRFEGPAGPVSVSWTIRPSFPPPFTLSFADLDGNGRSYILFDLPSTAGAFEAYDHLGALFGTYVPSVPQETDFEGRLIANFDGDPNDEIMFMHRDGDNQVLTLVQSNAFVDVGGPPLGLRTLQLGASRPNPATTQARIPYSVAARGPVTLRLLDVGGREVRTLVNGEVAAGSHEAIWDGRDGGGRAVPAGIYFYELSAAGERLGRRMVRLQGTR